MPELKAVLPILDVRDIETALQYYVERLGFEVDFRYGADPDNYAGVRRDGIRLHMQWQDEKHFRKGTAGQLRLRILVDDPDGLCAEYRARGVLNENTNVRETEWGTREFSFRDPDGNALSFFRDL